MATALEERPKADVLPREAGAGSLLNGHYAPPPHDGDGQIWVRTSVLIQGHPKKLYEMWRDVEAASSWHERITEVKKTGSNTYRWVMQSGEKKLEWEFEILADEPEKRIAWRSISGEPESAGEVIFEPVPGGRGTMVTVLEQWRMGKMSNVWESITGRGPKQSTIENLRHFKAMAETGEIPRSDPQPHGPRGTVGGMKRSFYGEKIATPAGTSPAKK